MKKAVSVLVAVLILFMFVCPFSSFAADDPTVDISSAKGTSGVDITITVKNSPGIASMKLNVEFNSAMVLKKVAYGEKTAEKAMQPQDKKSPVTLNWLNWQGGEKGLQDVKGDFVFATLTFEENSKLSLDDYKVSVSYDPGDLFNAAEKDIAFKVSGKAAGEVSSVESSSSASDTPVTDPGDDAQKDGYMDENGEYVGGEEELEIVEEGDTLTATGEIQSGKKKIIIWSCIAAAVLIAAAVVVVIVLKKRAVKEID